MHENARKMVPQLGDGKNRENKLIVNVVEILRIDHFFPIIDKLKMVLEDMLPTNGRQKSLVFLLLSIQWQDI